MAQLMQFMRETGWMALTFSISLYVFIMLYWIPRVLKPAKELLDDTQLKNHADFIRLQQYYAVLLVPFVMVFAPVFEELLFRAPLFIWGPNMSPTNEWILFLALDAGFVIIHPQYHYLPIRKALKGNVIGYSCREKTMGDGTRVKTEEIYHYENKIKAVIKAIWRSIQIGFWGFLCWKTMQWSGSYWGAVLCHSLINFCSHALKWFIVPILHDLRERLK